MNIPPPRKKVSKGPPLPRINLPKRNLHKPELVQDELLNVDEDWKKHWTNMPEFISVLQLPFFTVNVHFENEDDVKSFAVLIGQKVTSETKYLWWPKQDAKKVGHLRYMSDAT